MSAIIPLTNGAKLPAYLQNRAALSVINSDVVHGVSFPTLSIKGKVFTLVKGSERKVITRVGDDGEPEPVSYLNLTAVRANTKNRVFYAKAYVEGSEGEAARPDCYSSDGVAPAADSREPQAKKCQLCPHAVWGSKAGMEGKGTACAVNTRLAVVDPDQIMQGDSMEPYLLRVPAGSRSNFADVVKTAESRGIPYNALVLKVAFDMAAPSPKLTFKLVGLVDDDAYARVSGAYEDDTVKDIVGLAPVRERLAELPAPAGNTATEDDLEAALALKAAKDSTAAAKAAAAAKETDDAVAQVEAEAAAAKAEKVKQTKAAKAKEAAAAAVAKAASTTVDMGDLDAMMDAATPAAAPAAPAEAKPAKEAPVIAAPAPASSEDMSALLGDLDSLLGSTDD